MVNRDRPSSSTLDQIDCLSVEVGALLKRTALKVAVAESCTGGWLAQAITSVPGSSAWFDRGFVTYSNESKIEMLGVATATLAHHGAVSEAVVREMAQGAIRLGRAHISVAISGVAGPDGGTPDKPVGTVWIAWGQKRGYTEAVQFRLTGGRAAVRAGAVVQALEGLRQRLSQ